MNSTEVTRFTCPSGNLILNSTIDDFPSSHCWSVEAVLEGSGVSVASLASFALKQKWRQINKVVVLFNGWRSPQLSL